MDQMTDREYIAALEGAIRRTPPHNCAAARRPCCNPECHGEWGTGCHCCHHGQYHSVLRENAVEDE